MPVTAWHNYRLSTSLTQMGSQAWVSTRMGLHGTLVCLFVFFLFGEGTHARSALNY